MNKTIKIATTAAWVAFAAAPLVGSDFSHLLHGRTAALLTPAPRVQAADQASAGEGKILYYQDPMHPWYKSDKPGIAPDCGMKLVPVYASDAGALPPGGVEISSARQQLMGVATAKAEYRALDQSIRAVGQVAMDETRVFHVHVRTSGWRPG